MLGPTRVLRRSRAEAEPLARELLRKVGLAHKADDYPERLSGGQQQRVAIARSLAMQPRLMLFDEATSALDPELIGEVLNVMRDLARDGMTMLIVTHEMQFAEDVADRVVFMDHGRIVDEGPPHELFRAPSHPRTQAFLRAVVDRAGDDRDDRLRERLADRLGPAARPAVGRRHHRGGHRGRLRAGHADRPGVRGPAAARARARCGS